MRPGAFLSVALTGALELAAPPSRAEAPAKAEARAPAWQPELRPVGTREYVAIPILTALALAPVLLAPAPSAALVGGPVLFDGWVRGRLRLEGAGARKAAHDLSDVLAVASYAQPIVLDTLAAAWAVRGAPHVAWQMAVVSAQAYALTFALNRITKRVTLRERPWVSRCEDEAGGGSCGSGGRYSSFFSAHAAGTATNAGLVCAHHAHLELYGDPALDAAACAAAVLTSAATSGLRVLSDNHWATDVVVGSLVGTASGYLLPTLLYYGGALEGVDAGRQEGGQAHGLRFAVLPLLAPGVAQLVLFGQL